MAVQTFGVTSTTVGYEFTGLDFSALATAIGEWVTQSGAIVEAYLRRAGYDPEDVAGLGSSDSLYQLCAAFVLHKTAARLAISSSLQQPEMADWHGKEAENIEGMLRNLPEALTDEWDRNEQAGAFRTHVNLVGGLSGVSRSKPETRFRRGMRS